MREHVAVAFFVSGVLTLLGVLEWVVGGGCVGVGYVYVAGLLWLAWGILGGQKQKRGDDRPPFSDPVVAYVWRVRRADWGWMVFARR